MITGVSTGIGYAAAKKFLDHRYRVFGSVRSEADADRLRRLLGPDFSPLLFDVTQHDQIEEAAEEVGRALQGKPLSVLVNNAGIAVNGPLEYLDVADVRKQFEVNVIGLLKVTQTFLPHLKPQEEHPPGRIINIGSISGIIASPFTGAYAASKHALEGLSDSLRREMLIYGIEVVLLQPGPIKTDIWRKAKESDNPWLDTTYGPILRNRDRIIEKSEESALPAEDVARLILQAAEKNKPRLRYLIDRNPWKIRLASLLPARWLDKMVKKAFQKHLSGDSGAWRGWR